MIRPLPFTALRWQRPRLARHLRQLARNLGGIMLAGLLMLAFAYFGGRA